MYFTSLTHADDIGSHAYLLDLGGTRIILDCGIHPKKAGYTTLPDIRGLEPDSIDSILISHAHLDHIGGLPFLFRAHKEAMVVMSKPTFLVGKALLHNSVNVMKSQRLELGVEESPLFSHREIDEFSRSWNRRTIGQRFRIDPSHAESPVTCEFHPAGHVLGAVGISISYRDHNIFYTGDIHFEDQTLSVGAKLPEEGIDTLIVETTRGAQERDPDYTREKEKLRLGETIAGAFDRGGSALIPVFALGKTQETLLMLHELMGEGVIPRDTPIHIGGLSTKMTMLTDKIGDEWPRRHSDMELLEDLPTLRPLERGKQIPGARPGHIYLYSSGMMSEHTVSHVFAKYILPSSKNAVLFVGYCDPDSPAGKIQASEDGDIIVLEGKKIQLKCKVERFDFSGHSPRNQILDYIRRVNPSKVLLVHGDTPARQWFAEELADDDFEVIIPPDGERLAL